MNVLIAGATGNLGSLLTKHLLSSPHHVRLLTHKRALPFDLPPGANAEIVRGDLNDPASLRTVCKNIDCIVYLAGVLFQPHPEKFLHRTNTIYAQNLVDAALAGSVGKFILISFPHVEENTTPDNRACWMSNRGRSTRAPGLRRKNIFSAPAKVRKLFQLCHAPA